MATEVNFYHLTVSNLEEALPKLLAKTLQAGERAVVLLGSPERVDALNRKLAVISDTAQALTDIIDTQLSLRLEQIIVALIVIEVAMAAYQIFVSH